jgi:hypothetical protein
MDINIFGFKFRLEILILIVVVYFIMCGHLFCSCCKMNLMEGFTGANTNYGQSSPYTLGAPGYKPTEAAEKWGQPSLLVQPGKPLDSAVKKFLDRKPQPVPLPEGELNMFETTPFKPECCPNTYSNSMGCACMTGQQYNYLIERGGNNNPYSEY